MVSRKTVMAVTMSMLLGSAFLGCQFVLADKLERQCKAEYQQITADKADKAIYPWTQWPHGEQCYKYLDRW